MKWEGANFKIVKFALKPTKAAGRQKNRKETKSMKKTLSLILSIVMIITIMPQLSTNVAAAGYNPQTVVNLALGKVGTNYMNGYCLAFVRQCFESAYGYSSTACCAYKYGSRYIDSTSRDNIPLGADVFFGGSSKTCSTCGNKCGHIGIYVGDGYVVHGWSGKIEKFKIDRIINAGYPYRGWGWHNDMQLGEISTNPDDYSVPDRDLYYTAYIFRGSDVAWVQAVLYQLGYGIDIDMQFGPATKAVVEKFQGDNGLSVDGSVGPATREKLKQKWAEKKKSTVTISSISVAAKPTKTSYYVGDSFDASGLTLTATYSDGSKKTVTEDYSVSGFNSSTVGTKTITVYFDGKAATFTVTVSEKPAQTYTIAFNANSGTGSMSNLAMTVGTAKNLTANTFTRSGYTFLGWSTDKNATAATYTDKQSVKNLATSGTVTLYAVWKKDSTPVTTEKAIRAGDVSTSVGQSFKLPIYIDNTELAAVMYIVEYDTKVLELQQTDKSENSAFKNAIWTVDSAKGRITISCADADKTFSGKIEDILFKVIATTPCTTKIKVTVDMAGVSETQEVAVNGSEAVININADKPGDLNGNGRVDVLDALAALKASAGKIQLSEQQIAIADINKNGRVDVLDALAILKASAGKITL